VPRIARAVAPGLPHHVTQRGNNRCTVFFDDDDRRFYLWTLRQYADRHGVEVWGYCLMENHLHVLAVPGGVDSLARCFAGTNLVYTQRVNRKQARGGRLWQNRFFSCPVDKDEYLWPVLRYIDRNPVRAGLVRRPWDYDWSSARSHADRSPDPVLTLPGWLATEMGRRDYRAYLKDEADEQVAQIRRAASTGRPLGNSVFTALLSSRLHRRLEVGRAGRPRGKQYGKCP
jgi:putative transposase